MATAPVTALPEGFVLDAPPKPPASPGLPEGFVLDPPPESEGKTQGVFDVLRKEMTGGLPQPALAPVHTIDPRNPLEAPRPPGSPVNLPAPDPGYAPTDDQRPPVQYQLPPPGADPGASALKTAGSQFVRGVANVGAGALKAGGILEATRSGSMLEVLEGIESGEYGSFWDPRIQLSSAMGHGGMKKDIRAYFDAAPEDRVAIKQKYQQSRDPRTHPIYQKGEAVSRETAEAFPVNPEYSEEFWAGTVPQGLGSATGFAATGAAGRVIGAPALLTAGAAGSALEASSQFEQALAAGASLDDAFDAAGLGAIIGTSEAIPITHFLDRLDKVTGGGVKRVLSDAIKQGTEEAIQEAFQNIASNLTAIVKYDPERGVFTGTGEAGAAGFTVGALMQTIAAIALPGRYRGADPAVPPPAAGTPVDATMAQPMNVQAQGTLPEGYVLDTPPAAPQAPQNVPEGAVPAADVIGEEEPPSGREALRKIMEDGRPLEEIQAEAEAAAETAAQEAEKAAQPVGTRDKPADAAVPGEVDQAAAQADPAPSPAQKDAGTYKKGHVKWQGLDITIENAAGSERAGMGADGLPWSVTMPVHYGYVKRTNGADGDQVDVYVGESPESDQVVVIDQIDPATGKFDETKAMVGMSSEADALATYDAAFSDGSGPVRRGAMTVMTVAEFKEWLARGDTRKALAYEEPAEPSTSAPGLAGSVQRGEPPASAPVFANEGLPGADISSAEAKAMQASFNRREAARTRKRPSTPRDILQFIADEGGISDPDGDLKQMGAERVFIPGAGKMLRAAAPHPDKVRLRAEEEGYLPQGASINDLYALVDAQIRTGQRQFSEFDRDRVAKLADAETAKDIDFYAKQVAKTAKDNGIRLTAAEIEEISQTLYTDGGNVIDEIVDFAERNYVEEAIDFVAKTGDTAGLPIDIPGFEAATDETATDQRPAQGGAVDEGEGANARPQAEQTPADEARGEPRGADREAADVEPTTEPTPAGPQTVIPGAERITEKQQAERAMEGPAKAKVPQKDADEGLFDVGGRGQEEMFAAAEPSRAFYSKALRAVQDARTKKADGAQWLATLRNAGVKEEEIAWLGIDSFLDGRKATTKADLEAFVQANLVELQEVTKSSSRAPEPNDVHLTDVRNWAAINLDAEGLNDVEEALLDIHEGDVGRVGVLEEQGIPDELLEPYRNFHGENAPKFSTYTLPGGENYRELLLTLPEKPSTFDPSKVEIKRHLRSVTQGETSIWYDGKKIIAYSDDPVLKSNGEYKQKPDSHWMEVARDLYEKGDRINKIPQRGEAFTGGHYDEPNVLAHIRFNERTRTTYTPDQIADIGERIRKAVGASEVRNVGSGAPAMAVKQGVVTPLEAAQFSHSRNFIADQTGAEERILFIEEIQSDWHQKGRKQGYAKASRSVSEIHSDMEALVNELRSREPSVEAGPPGAMHPAWRRHLDLQQRVDSLLAEEQATRGVPDAPFKKTWHELALRRMVRYAAENGFDSVAWTTGEQQADRYDLSKQVERIEYKLNDDETADFEVIALDSFDSVMSKRGATRAEVSDSLGKDVADNMFNDSGIDDESFPEGFKALIGDDLRVGGEGMKSFYDRMLPNYANKLGKKFGAKVGRVGLSTDTLNDGQFEAVPMSSLNEDGQIIVHSLPITPALREIATAEGFPMFAGKGDGPVAPFPDDIIDQIEATLKRLAPSQNLEVLPGSFRPSFGSQAGVRGSHKAALDLVTVALTGDPLMTVRHEAIHALRAGGLFTGAEWRLLENLSNKVWRDQYNIDARYRDIDPNITESQLTEEGVAFAFENWWKDGKTDPRARRLFQRIKDFFERLGNALRGMGYQTMDDVFAKVESGEAGQRRPRHDPQTGGVYHALMTEEEAYRFKEKEEAATGYAWYVKKRKMDDGTVYWIAGTVHTPLRATDPNARAPIPLTMTPQAKPGKFDEFARPERKGPRGLTKEDGETFALVDPSDGNVASEAKRQRAMQGFIAKGHPVDRAMRIPFHIFGGIDAKGNWKPGKYLSEGSGNVIQNAKFDKNGSFSWLNGPLQAARAGLMDRYGLEPDYVSRDRQRDLDERRILAEANEILTVLKDANIGAEEAKVLQAVLTGEQIPDADWAKLSDPIRQAIDTLGEEALTLGLISPESFERNKGTYLHRVYAKHETQITHMGRWVTKVMSSRRKKIIGEQFKGRGMFMDIKAPRLMRDIADYAEGKRGGAVTGEHFIVLDRIAEQGDFEGMEGGKEKIVERVYWPADKKIPERYADYTDKGTWEARFIKGGTVTLWRDFTKAERASMGEILDARYTIAKTFMLMAHDLANGRFYQDIATNEQWSRATEPDAEWRDASEYSRFWMDDSIEWVKVPDTTIPKSGGKKKWAALAGKYVRAEIWRDLNEVDMMQKKNMWTATLTNWKLMKTARSPVVHMNNVMSNLLFMDMADVRTQDLVKGLRSYVKGDRFYQDAAEHGAFGADMMSQEIRKQIMEPVLKEIMNIPTAGQHPLRARMGVVGGVMAGIWDKVRALDAKMVDLYRVEDEVFRMATYMRRLSLGDTPAEAAIFARQQFLDYDIRAPWVNLARRTALPFISYTYRAVPVIARSIAHRPWKMAKYFAMAYGANALAYMIAPGDEDEERRSLRDEERGYTWVGVPRMQRMPWRDAHGSPVFLDIRRWIPAGDVFDMNQGSSSLPIPAPIQFGGPLMMAAELMLNKQAFTGKEIVNDKTDDLWDKSAKIGDWAYKSWMPSAAWIPGSWYWEKIANAGRGATDRSGTPYSLPAAFASSIGIKIKPQDIDQNFASRQYEFNLVERALRREMSQANYQRQTGRISQAEFEAVRERIKAKLGRLSEDARERLKRSPKQ